MLKAKIKVNRAARQLDPKVLNLMKRSMGAQLEQLRQNPISVHNNLITRGSERTFSKSLGGMIEIVRS